jgi:hypothetical protein
MNIPASGGKYPQKLLSASLFNWKGRGESESSLQCPDFLGVSIQRMKQRLSAWEEISRCRAVRDIRQSVGDRQNFNADDGSGD